MVFFHLFQPLGIDFPQYYEAARMALMGLNPYVHLLTSPGPFNYPPPSFLFLIWFGLLPFNLSGPVWNILSVLALVGSLWLLLRLARNSSKFPLIPGFFLLFFLFTLPFFPVKHNLASGQINLFLLFFVVASQSLYLDKRKNLSALFLAFAIAIKLLPAFFLLYYVIVADWKQLVRIVLFTAVFFLLSFAILPWTDQQVYYTHVVFQSFSLAGKDIYYNQSLLAFLLRSFPITSARLLNYAFAILIITLTYLKGRGLSHNRIFAAVACLPLLLSPLAWQHHFVLALVPIVLLTFETLKRGFKLKILAVIAMAYVLLAINIAHPEQIPSDVRVLLSHEFFGVLLLWLLALWKEKFWEALTVVWATLITSLYIFMLLCRAKICF